MIGDLIFKFKDSYILSKLNNRSLPFSFFLSFFSQEEFRQYLLVAWSFHCICLQIQHRTVVCGWTLGGLTSHWALEKCEYLVNSMYPTVVCGERKKRIII